MFGLGGAAALCIVKMSFVKSIVKISFVRGIVNIYVKISSVMSIVKISSVQNHNTDLLCKGNSKDSLKNAIVKMSFTKKQSRLPL